MDFSASRIRLLPAEALALRERGLVSEDSHRRRPRYFDGRFLAARDLTREQAYFLARQAAYAVVQRVAMRAWTDRRPFRSCLDDEPEVTKHLAPDRLDACFDPAWYLRHVDAVYRRLGLAEAGPGESPP